MRLTLLLMLTTLAGACVNVNQTAICEGTRAERDALADALLLDGGDASVIAGHDLISKLDAGCDDTK
jgi:hypothetical protein